MVVAIEEMLSGASPNEELNNFWAGRVLARVLRIYYAGTNTDSDKGVELAKRNSM